MFQTIGSELTKLTVNSTWNDLNMLLEVKKSYSMFPEILLLHLLVTLMTR